MTSLLSWLVSDGIPLAAPVLAFRLTPFVGVILFSTEYPSAGKLGLLGIYLSALVAAGGNIVRFQGLAISYGYFSIAALMAYRIAELYPSKATGAMASILLFWIAPLTFIHPAPAYLFVLGWDFTLAAYSYHADAPRNAESTPTLRDYLFFLMINPAIVYPRRGRRVTGPTFHLGGAGRVAMGIVAMMASAAIEGAVSTSVRSTHTIAAAAIVVGGATRIGREYAVHSGLAGVQIGMMRQLGYEVPERYRYPLLARSPSDFWRRWNTYIGTWARLYVFKPLATVASRRKWNRSVIGAFAVLVTFGFVGLIHDLYRLAAVGALTLDTTWWFLTVAVLALTWAGMRSTLKLGTSGLRRSLEWMVFWITACLLASRL